MHVTLTGYLPTRPKATRAVTAAVRAPWKSCTRLACGERAGVASAGPAHDSSLDAPVPVPVGRGGDSDFHPGGRPHDGGTPEQLRAQFSGLTAACSHATMTKCCLDKKRLLHAQALRCTEPRAAHNSVTTAVTCCFSHIVWRLVNVGAVQMEWWHLGVAAPFPSRLATHWGH